MKKQSKAGTAMIKAAQSDITVPGALNMPPKIAKAMKVAKKVMKDKYKA